jgi:hypothetical protein
MSDPVSLDSRDNFPLAQGRRRLLLSAQTGRLDRDPFQLIVVDQASTSGCPAGLR